MKELNDIIIDLYNTKVKLNEIKNILERIHFDLLEIRDKETDNGRNKEEKNNY